MDFPDLKYQQTMVELKDRYMVLTSGNFYKHSSTGKIVQIICIGSSERHSGTMIAWFDKSVPAAIIFTDSKDFAHNYEHYKTQSE